ncbi:MAG: pseudouridine synthase [Leptospirillia bacterium]
MTTQGSDFDRSPDDSPDSQEEADGRLRLHKLLAHRGVASRRKSEQLIAAGSVTVDGEVVTEPGTRVDPTTQDVLVDGRPLPRESETFLFLFYKPKGVVSTLFDPEGRPTLKDYFPGIDPILHIGRLDFQTEGALLLTNNGDLSQRILHPRFEIPRTYLVKIQGGLTPAHLERMAQGDVKLDGRAVLPLELVLERQTSTNAWYRITLTEGRNREVRRLFETLNYFVLKLVRTAFGPLTLSGLEPGEYRTVTPAEIESLLAGTRPGTHSKNLDSRYGRDSGREPGKSAPRAGGFSETQERYRRPAGGADRPRRFSSEESPDRPTRTGPSRPSFSRERGERTPREDFSQGQADRDFRRERPDSGEGVERAPQRETSGKPFGRSEGRPPFRKTDGSFKRTAPGRKFDEPARERTFSERSDRPARPARTEWSSKSERSDRPPGRFQERSPDREFRKTSDSRPPREGYERDRGTREPRREGADRDASTERSSRPAPRPFGRAEGRPPFRKTEGSFKRSAPGRKFDEPARERGFSERSERPERSEGPGRSERFESSGRSERPSPRPFGRSEGRPPFRKTDGSFKRGAPGRKFDEPARERDFSDRPAWTEWKERSDRPDRTGRPARPEWSGKSERSDRPSERFQERSPDREFRKNSDSRSPREGFERDRGTREPRRERPDSREGAGRDAYPERSARAGGRAEGRPPFRKTEGSFKRSVPGRKFDEPARERDFSDRPARPERQDRPYRPYRQDRPERSERPERSDRPPGRSRESSQDRPFRKSTETRPPRAGFERDRETREPRREGADNREGADRKPRPEWSSRPSGRSDARTAPQSERGGPRKSSPGGAPRSARPTAGRSPSSSGPKRPGSPSGKRGPRR